MDLWFDQAANTMGKTASGIWCELRNGAIVLSFSALLSEELPFRNSIYWSDTRSIS